MQTEEVLMDLTAAAERKITLCCFVCTGNTCRSPMAAALTNFLGARHGLLADSRGVNVTPGAPIAKNAIAALKARGVESTPQNDYANHRARQIAAEDFEAFDLIFALSSKHASALLFAFPQYAGKIRVLGEIADPFGLDENAYKQALADIEAALIAQFPYLKDEKN